MRVEPEAGSAGLTEVEAHARLARFGPNEFVPRTRRPSVLTWIIRPFADPMVLLLLAAGVVYVAIGDFLDATIILIAVVPIALVSLVLEGRAERALDKLRQLTSPTALVWRNGSPRRIPVEEIVTGDLVDVKEGDVIPADGMLFAREAGSAASQLMVDESALTGEWQPVVKDVRGPEADHLVFAGTTVLSGTGTILVTETGPRTRYGQIGTLLAGIRQPATPLQRVIRRLVAQSFIVAAFFCAGVAAIELAYGHGLVAAISAAVSLAIAAMPEQFPMVYTLYLTLGAWRLARERALVRRLASVETLGSTTVICADKTGTLTLGQMQVAALVADSETVRLGAPIVGATRALLEDAVLACEPRPFDPLEQAILREATAQGVDERSLTGGKLVEDYPFDPLLKYMSHVWEHDSHFGIYAKGATEGILDRSHATSDVRRQAIEANNRLAAEGLRVIGVAAGTLDQPTGDRVSDECHLVFRGLIAFADPLREGVMPTLRECGAAGIRVIMITGDHPVTAHAVAEGLGLPHPSWHEVATGAELDAATPEQFAEMVREVNIFARIRPEQKYRLVEALRAQHQIVAMTGDGINDAPALREADIGVAMGQRGTEVAREAADLVLLDDNFATIVHAVRDGRRIFESLRRAFAYLVAFKVPLLLGAFVIPLVGIPLLFLPVQLVWSELIVHPTASLVFENDPPPADLMERPPRPPEAGLLSSSDFIRSLAEGTSLFVGIAAVYLFLLQRGLPTPHARAVGITTLLIGQCLLVLVERSPVKPIWTTGVGGNRVLPIVLSVTLGSLLIALYVPPVTRVLSLAPISGSEWLLAIAVAAVSTLWLEPVKWLQQRPLAPP